MSSLEKIKKIKGRRFLFDVERSLDPSDYKKYEDLRNEIWADESDTLAGDRNLANENYFDKGGALFIALYAEDRKKRLEKTRESFIGFAYGFVGVKNKKKGFVDPENLAFYSQYLAVKKDFQSFGLGIAIKEFQRDVLLSVFKIKAMTCTFDPLTGVNAYRNIHRFGMQIRDYKESYYENFIGHLNRHDVPTDRFFVYWDMSQEKSGREIDLEKLLAEAHRAYDTEMTEVRAKNGLMTLDIPLEAELKSGSEFVLIEIPRDFYNILQQTDVEDHTVRNIAVQWRLTSRTAFTFYLMNGYVIADFQTKKIDHRNRNFYILKRA